MIMFWFGVLLLFVFAVILDICVDNLEDKLEEML